MRIIQRRCNGILRVFIWALLLLCSLGVLTEYSSIKSNYVSKKSYQHDICILAQWKGRKLAPYHRLFLNSANHSTGHVIFLHENLDNIEHLQIHYSSVEFLNVGDNLDQFVGLRMCDYFNIGHQSKECKDLNAAFIGADGFTWGSASAQYRIMLGAALNLEHCKSWAYIDHDSVLGNVEKFIKGNDWYWSSDVVGFFRDFNDGAFLPAQFTSYIHYRNNSFINSIFSYCNLVESPQAIINSFTGKNSFYGMDEGCIFDGALKSGATVRTAPYQTDDTINDFILLHNGNLYGFKKSDLKDSKSSIRLLEPPILSEMKPESVLLRYSNETKGCLWWIDEKYRYCIDQESYSPPSNLDMGQSWYQYTEKGKELIASVPKNTKNYEYPYAHLKGLKKTIKYVDFKDHLSTHVIFIEDQAVTSFETLEMAIQQMVNKV